MKGRAFIIGDLHANHGALEGLLGLIAPSAGDLLVFLGDYLDKNPHTRETLSLLKALEERCRCVFLRGNHEFAWERYLDHGELARRGFLLGHGGMEALTQFCGDPGRMLAEDRVAEMRRMLAGYLDIVRRAGDYMVVGRYLATHAGLLESQLDDPAPRFEERNYFLRPRDLVARRRYMGRLPIVAGHTAQAGGVPFIGEGYINIDLGAGYPGGFLGALDVRRGEVVRSDGARFPVPWPGPG